MNPNPTSLQVVSPQMPSTVGAPADSQEFDLWAGRIRRVVWIRWWGIIGLLVMTALARWLLKLDVSLTIVGLAAIALAGTNVYAMYVVRAGTLYPPLALILILVDMAALTVVLFFSDGLRNPFFTLYFFHIVLARILLPTRVGYAIIALTTVLFLFLFLAPELRRLGPAEGIFAYKYFLHVAGTPISFVLTALCTAYLVNMLILDLRNRDSQYQEERDRRRQTEKLAALGQLAGGVAHEINTPLGTIGMAAEDSLSQIERGEVDTRELRDTLEVIRDQTKRCSAITRGLLSLSRQTELQCARIELRALVQETVDLLRHRAGDVNIRVRTEDPLPPAQADPNAVRQILVNLILNALDAVEDRPQADVEVACHGVDGVPAIDVLDNGDGIPEQDQDRIFDPFFTTKDVGRGTGLGLAISYGLARDMNGGLELVDGGPGHCCFRLRLPLESAI